MEKGRGEESEKYPIQRCQNFLHHLNKHFEWLRCCGQSLMLKRCSSIYFNRRHWVWRNECYVSSSLYWRNWLPSETCQVDGYQIEHGLWQLCCKSLWVMLREMAWRTSVAKAVHNFQRAQPTSHPWAELNGRRQFQLFAPGSDHFLLQIGMASSVRPWTTSRVSFQNMGMNTSPNWLVSA